MQMAYIGFGREINAPNWQGAWTGKRRGVKLLHQEDWQTFIDRMRHVAMQFGRIVFEGSGHGLNTITGEPQEPGYCIALEYTNPLWYSIDTFKDSLAKVAKDFGQLEVAVCIGYSTLVPTGA